MSLYEYVYSDPTYCVDSFGLKCIDLVITFDKDWKTWWGGALTPGTGVDVTLDKNEWDWGKAQKAVEALIKKYDPECKDGDCFKSVTIVGHGASGKAGGFERGSEKGDVKDPSTPAHKLLDFIKRHLCKETTEVELRTCESAKGEEGKAFIEEFALVVGLKVKGWDDWYAVIPHGDEYTSEPGKPADKTGSTGRTYKD